MLLRRVYVYTSLVLFSGILGHARADLHPVPRLDDVAERGIHHALLLEHRLAAKRLGGNLNRVHAAAAARDVLHEHRGHGRERVDEQLRDGGLGVAHGGGLGGGGGGGGGVRTAGAEGQGRRAGSHEGVLSRGGDCRGEMAREDGARSAEGGGGGGAAARSA